MLKVILKDRRGQAYIEMLFVFPLLFMLFSFIVETGYLMYDWAVINYQTSTAAVSAATEGQFNDTIRLRLAENIRKWTVNGRDYNYSYGGTTPPGSPEQDTVYIYGTGSNEQVQRGNYIHVSVDYPWRFKFFLIDALGSWIIDEKNLRLSVSCSFPSEVYFE